jgi:hypothetical protein
MPPAESLRGLGLLAQKQVHGMVLTFLENPSGGNCVDPLSVLRVVAGAVGSSISMMNMVLAINVHGSGFFQQPQEFPQQMLDRSIVLKRTTTSGAFQADPCVSHILPPSPLDGQHLDEWREAADYAATRLSMLAAIVDLEATFKSPLLGGWKRA